MPFTPSFSTFTRAHHSSPRVAPVGVFETLESVFLALTCGATPLALYGRHLGEELPERPIPLHLLRLRLAATPVSDATRAAVFSALVRRARTPGPTRTAWTIGLAGTALPELVHIVTRVAPGYRGPVEDLQAAALAGLIAEFRRLDPTQIAGPRIRRRLISGADRATRALRALSSPTRQPGTHLGRTPAGGRIARLDRANPWRPQS